MQRGTVLALDYGTKRVGLATGDLETRVAFAREVMENKGDLLERVLDFCGEWDVVKIVVGLPLSMEEGQEENKLNHDIRNFTQLLMIRAKGIDVELFDERLSSFEADKLMQEAGKDLHKDRKNFRDAYAAQVILQRYFDTL